jgi:phosphatidylinositol alpha-1,6-mannosyltransferase
MSKQLLLVYDFPPMGGGIARWMGELARRFPPGSLVISTGQYPGSAATDAQFPNRVDRLPMAARRLRTIQGTVRWSRHVVALARLWGVEFTWCGNLKPAAYPARWIKTHLGVPYGIMLHGGDLLILRNQARHSLLKRRMAAALLRSASVLVTNSLWTADLCRVVLDDLGISGRADVVRTLGLGADPKLFRPGLDQAEVRARYALDGRRWLLSVARLTQHKGIDTSLRALARIASKYPDVGYMVIGSGDDLARLKGLASELGIADRVRFLLDVPDHDLAPLYNCAEVYLGLSRVMEERVEGFGISLVEASACGLPVLASRTGGIPDAVRDGETGLLVEVDRLEQISASLRVLLDDRTLARRLGEAGRRAVEAYYNWDRVASELARMGQEHGKR